MALGESVGIPTSQWERGCREQVILSWSKKLTRRLERVPDGRSSCMMELVPVPQ